MKLYATTTSERASKGQGGNKFIEIKLQVGDERRVIAILKLQETETGSYALDLYKYGQDEGECLCLLQDDKQIEIETKGKKQKGECRHFIVKDDYGKEYCQECGKYSFQR